MFRFHREGTDVPEVLPYGLHHLRVGFSNTLLLILILYHLNHRDGDLLLWGRRDNGGFGASRRAEFRRCILSALLKNDLSWDTHFRLAH